MEKKSSNTKKITFSLVPREKQNSDYDWLNIDYDSSRIGKARCIISEKKLTIYSINIFPEFERCGHATRTIEMFKESFDTIIADRVRFTAIGFWEKMGFVQIENDTYKYIRN